MALTRRMPIVSPVATPRGFASPAAADPTGIAVVESLTGNPSGVEFMDYVRAGQVIRLGPHQNHRAELYGFMCAGNHYGGTVTAVQELRELRPTALTDSCIASSLVGSVFVERRKLLYLQSFAVASFAPSART